MCTVWAHQNQSQIHVNYPPNLPPYSRLEQAQFASSSSQINWAQMRFHGVNCYARSAPAHLTAQWKLKEVAAVASWVTRECKLNTCERSPLLHSPFSLCWISGAALHFFSGSGTDFEILIRIMLDGLVTSLSPTDQTLSPSPRTSFLVSFYDGDMPHFRLSFV